MRPATASDADFLRDLFVARRWDEMAVTGWPEDVLTAFLRDQHRLQVLHYDTHYAGALRFVVECERVSAGTLMLLDMGSEIRLVDIAMMPAFRGRGIGALLVRWVQDIALTEGCSKVSLHVDPRNPAKRLYQRLGFQVADLRGIDELMEWTSGQE